MEPKPKPPQYLSLAGKKLWKSLHNGHAIDDPGGLVLLDSLCSAYDRVESARKILATEGLVVEGRQGSKPHPAIMIEHNARATMHTALRLLKLSPEEVR
jgi:P27 family predicted phage terminase small subunit